MIQKVLSQCTQLEKKTFKYHLIYSIIEGIIFGILSLNEFVFIKSLRGSSIQMGILFQFTMSVFILLIFFNVYIKRSKNKNNLLRKTAIVSRLPLLLLLLFPRTPDSFLSNPYYHYIFLILFLIFYLESPITYPMVNLFLKKNYKHQHFGMLFGFTTTINKIVTLFSTLFYGIMLDIDNYAFTYILPLAAILGVISIFTLSKIEYNDENNHETNNGFTKSVKESIKTMKSIIQTNHPFRHFEIGFMLYGFAFMITVTVITLFFERMLHLNYTSVAFYKNGFNIIAIASIPLFGKLITHIDPRKLAMYSFLSMMLAIGFIALTQYFQYHFIYFEIKIYYLLLLYILFYGLFIGSMSIVWRIGSAYFCSTEESAIYQSVHLSATSVRALFAPLLGVIIYELIGFTYTFIIAILFLLLAASVLIFSLKTEGLTIKN